MKTFSGSFVPFLEDPSNFKHFGKRDDRHSFLISEIRDCQRLWLDHSLKSTVSENPLNVNMLKRVPNTCKIGMRTLSSYFFVIPREPDWENISFNDMLTPGVAS